MRTTRPAQLRALGLLILLCGTALSAQHARGQQPEQSASPSAVRTGVQAGLGVALGAEGGSAAYFQFTVPIQVSRRWAVGPSFVNLSEIGDEAGFQEEDGGVEFGGDARFAVGLEVRRALGALPFGGYVGVRGMYSISKYGADGAYGGLLVGGEYALTSHLALGAEVQALRSPERFLFVPLGSLTLHF